MTNKENECCPKFNPEKWDEKTQGWTNKPFIKETIPTLFHIPFPPMIGKKITKMLQMIEEDKKLESNKENMLILFRDPSAFKSEIYISVTGPVKDADNVDISGAFVSKVFSGSYNAIPKFIKQLDEYLSTKKQKAKDYYIHYTYCPKCAKKYGDNYIVIFAKI